MKTPKIIFKYSWIYDQTWKEGWLMKKVKNYPSERKILNYIKKVEKLWRKDEKKVLKELSKVSHLKWKAKSIDCYIVGRCRSFSWPLTVRIFDKDLDHFIDVLIHELIHNLFIQNFKELSNIRQYLGSKYKKETKTTNVHIIVHAFHSHIYLKFYNEKRLKKDIKFISRFSDYKKSWEIVQKEDYQNIINEFIKRVK